MLDDIFGSVQFFFILTTAALWKYIFFKFYIYSCCYFAYWHPPRHSFFPLVFANSLQKIVPSGANQPLPVHGLCFFTPPSDAILSAWLQGNSTTTLGT